MTIGIRRGKTILRSRRRRAALLLLAVSALAPPASPAESPRAEGPPAAAEPSGWSFDVGWNDGPTYEISDKLPGLRRYDRGWLSDVALRGRFGGSLYLDGGWLDTDGADDGFQGKLRRARLYTQGEWVRANRPTEYRVQFAFEDGSFFLNDFYFRWRPPRAGSTRSASGSSTRRSASRRSPAARTAASRRSRRRCRASRPARGSGSS